MARSFTLSAALVVITTSVYGVMALPENGKRASSVPALAQVVDQRSFNVLPTVLTAEDYNGSSVSPSIRNPTGFLAMLTLRKQPPLNLLNTTKDALLDKPFHVYDDEFLDVIGSDPTFTLLATTPKDPIFHEAVVWYKPTDEAFFVQNAGNPDAGTGLDKSAAIYKISLKEADAVKSQRNATGKVTVTLVPSKPEIPNPNGKKWLLQTRFIL